MNTTLHDIEEWTGHRQPGGDFPWLRVLGGVLLALVIIGCMTGCAHTTLYRDGRKLAVLQGDMTGVRFQLSAAGDLAWQADKVDHSTATKAQGEAAAGKINAAALAVSGVTYLLNP